MARDGTKGAGLEWHLGILDVGEIAWKNVKSVMVNNKFNYNKTSHCSGKSLTQKTESDGNLGYVLEMQLLHFLMGIPQYYTCLLITV